MARPRTKGGEPGDKLPHIGATVSQEFYDRFDSFCKAKMAVKAAVIVRAVQEYMDREAPTKGTKGKS
jgi:hypothetical protein